MHSRFMYVYTTEFIVNCTIHESCLAKNFAQFCANLKSLKIKIYIAYHLRRVVCKF